LGFGRGERGDGGRERAERAVVEWVKSRSAGRRDISVGTCIHLRVGPYTRRVADPQVGDRDTLGRVFAKAVPRMVNDMWGRYRGVTVSASANIDLAREDEY
jgi:hypothetical protein